VQVELLDYQRIAVIQIREVCQFGEARGNRPFQQRSFDLPGSRGITLNKQNRCRHLWFQNLVCLELTYNFTSFVNLPKKSGTLPDKLFPEILLLQISLVGHYERIRKAQQKIRKIMVSLQVG
jgi:hypothetical protein